MPSIRKGFCSLIARPQERDLEISNVFFFQPVRHVPFLLARQPQRSLSHRVPKSLIYLLLVLVTASWGAVLPVLRHMNLVREGHGVTAWDVVWLRLVPGALFFIPLLITRRRQLMKLGRDAWLPIVLVGLCTTSLYNFFLVTGEERVSASIASLVIGVNPSTTFLLAVLFLGEPATIRKVAGIALSLAGLLYISRLSRSGKENVDFYYLLLTTLAPVAFSFGTVVGKRMLRGVDPLTLTAATIVAGAVPLLPLPVLQGNLIQAAPLLPASFWASAVFLVLVPLVFGYSVWYHALDRLDASQVSAFVFLVPVFGVAFSSFSEPVTLAVILGGAAVLGGVLLTNWNSPGTSAKPAELEPKGNLP